MLSYDMKPLTPYRVIKDSFDTSLQKGDIVWLSENGDLNLADPTYPGWLTEREWKTPETSDFEIVPAPDYKLICLGRTETIIKTS